MTRARIWSFAKTLIVFLLLGPPLGALTFMGMLAGVGLLQADGGAANDVLIIILFALIYAMPLSYLIGILPAGIVGAMIAAYQAWRGPVAWWLALAIGAVAGLWLSRAGGGPIPTAMAENSHELWPILRLVTLVATCLVPTMLCWLLTRRWGVPAMLGAAQRYRVD